MISCIIHINNVRRSILGNHKMTFAFVDELVRTSFINSKGIHDNNRLPIITNGPPNQVNENFTKNHVPKD